ncbi:MAG: histidinol-phosphatase [Turicibacter sp.]
MIQSNFHTHTARCLHAGGEDYEFVEAAIKGGMKVFGFSDHAPFPDNRDGLRMQYAQLGEYLDSMKVLKEKYKDEIELRIGLEIEYDPSQCSYYEKLLNEGFDYLAFGQHIYVSGENEFTNIYVLDNTEQYVAYALTVVEGMKSGYFAFVAHPDVIFLNNFAWDENCELACNLIIEGAKEFNVPLELNANGLRRGIQEFVDGKRYPYPHEKFWIKVAAMNLPVLINADAHSPRDVYDWAMEEAYELASKLGLNVISDYK